MAGILGPKHLFALVLAGRMEINVHLCERATHPSQSEVCIVFNLIIFQATLPVNVWLSHSNLLVLRSPQLSFTSGSYVHVGMDLYR